MTAVDAKADAAALKAALESSKPCESTISGILCLRSGTHLSKIREHYKTETKRELKADIKGKLKGDYARLMKTLIFDGAEADAVQINKAIKGTGTDEKCLTQIICARTNAELRALRATYKKMFGKDLLADICGDTSGDFRRILVHTLAACRDEAAYTNVEYAQQDAQALVEAGVKQLGTDESTFLAIITAQNSKQLQLLFQEYKRLAKQELEDSIEKELSGDTRLALQTIVKYTSNPVGYYATLLHEAIQGIGTSEKTINRILASRRSKDLLLIKQEYMRLFKEPLDKAIAGDTSGSYKDALLLLLQ